MEKGRKPFSGRGKVIAIVSRMRCAGVEHSICEQWEKPWEGRKSWRCKELKERRRVFGGGSKEKSKTNQLSESILA